MFLERTGMTTYTSEFGRNFEKYGYVDQDPQDLSHTVNWKSSIMTRDEAYKLAEEFISVAKNYSGQYPGSMMEITTYGKFQWKDIIKHYRKFNNIIIEHIKPSFIKEYKKKLSDLVVEKSSKVL